MSNTITLTILLNTGNAAQVIQELNKNVSNLGGSVNAASGSMLTFNDFATKVGFRLQGITSIINALTGTFGAWIAESNAGEQASTKLSQSLRRPRTRIEFLLKRIRTASNNKHSSA